MTGPAGKRTGFSCRHHRVSAAGSVLLTIPDATSARRTSIDRGSVVAGTWLITPVKLGSSRRTSYPPHAVPWPDNARQPGITGIAPPAMNAGTSSQPCTPSAPEIDSCITPRGSATYTVDGLAAITPTGRCRLALGASEFTPSMLTYDTGCSASLRLTAMSSSVRHDNDTTEEPNPNPSRRG